MRRMSQAPLFILVLLACGAVISCKTNFDSMVEEYTECFEPTIATYTSPNVGDNGFDSRKMIPQETYTIPMGVPFVIIATSGGGKYEWTFNGKTVYACTTAVFRFEGNTKEYKVGVPYELRLLVTDKNLGDYGTTPKTYPDSATIYFTEGY